MDEPNRGRLRVLLENLPNENVGFVMKCLCLPDPKTGRSTAVDHVRPSHPSDSIVRKLYALISQCHRLEEALASCREGQRHYLHDLELLFHERVVRKQLGDAPGAEGCLLRMQFASEGDHFASVNPALRGAIARHNLGVLYREEGRDAEAETYWHAVVADNPDYLPSWIGLSELYLSQGRLAEFDEALARLEADGRAAAATAMLRARAAVSSPGRDDG